jgi:predicted transcriptional regulator
MRTTVEISDPLYRRVRALAAARGERGFSPIVETAIREYLDREGSDETRMERFAAARGAWGADEAEQVVSEIRDAWSTWQISQ